MRNLTLSEAFSRYGVRVKPTAGVVYAWTEQGALVLICRHDRFRRPLNGVLAYVGEFADEVRKNDPSDLERQLQIAFSDSRSVHAIIARSADPTDVGRRSPVWFHVRPDLFGTVAHLDVERFVLHFTKRPFLSAGSRHEP